MKKSPINFPFSLGNFPASTFCPTTKAVSYNVEQHKQEGYVLNLLHGHTE